MFGNKSILYVLDGCVDVGGPSFSANGCEGIQKVSSVRATLREEHRNQKKTSFVFCLKRTSLIGTFELLLAQKTTCIKSQKNLKKQINVDQINKNFFFFPIEPV